MNTPFEITDETLMAYADGELDAAQATQVEQWLQQDAAAAAKVAQHRALAAQLRNGFSAALTEPVPERLLNVLQPNANTRDKVVDFSQALQRKTTTRSWSSREWSAIAASLIVGMLVGVYALQFNSTNLVGAQHGELIAQGKLDSALTRQLAGANAAQGIQIGISFRNHAGEYCRSFALQDQGQDTQALAGLACRTQGNWRVRVLTESAQSGSSEFKQAGSTTPAAVLALIDQQIAGEALDAEAEAAARQKGWQ